MLHRTILLVLISLAPLSGISCDKITQHGDWKKVTFMDCNNVIHKVTIKLSNAVYDNQSGYLKVEGVVKNRLKEYRLFNVRNWVYRLNEQGEFLKPQSVGLPSLPLPAVTENGTSREEKFVLIYKIGNPGFLSEIVLEYADQFFMTGQINKFILSVSLKVTSGTVTSRG